MIISRLESEIERIIMSSGCKILKRPAEAPLEFDFGIEHTGKKIAIEVKPEATAAKFSGILGYQVPAAARAHYDEFWLITTHEPPEKRPIPASTTIAIDWLSVDGLAKTIGAPPGTNEALQDRKVALLDVLSGQFDPKKLKDIHTDEQLESFLNLGRSQDQVTAVFADIKSFTAIVHNSDPATLNAMLSKYYNTARTTAQSYGGTFDKVIGDAVLSVFNYPPIPNSVAAAVKYAITLVQSGVETLRDFVDSSTAVVETGIRVGIATGQVWPIDVGQKIAQISFFGDPLNLAARLQHRAATNGIAICRTSWLLFEKQDPTLAGQLGSEVVQIPKGDLAGIETAINCQLIVEEHYPILLILF